MVGYNEDFEKSFEEGDLFMNDGFVEAIERGKIVTVEESYAFREGLPILKHVGDNKIENIQEKVWKEEGKSKKEDMEGKGLIDLLANNSKSQIENVLFDHFNWKVCKARRKKAMTRKVFGELVGLNLKQIKMLENGIFPSNDLTLLARIEEVLEIHIRKVSEEFGQPMRRMVEEKEDSTVSDFFPEAEVSENVKSVVDESIKNNIFQKVDSAENLIQESSNRNVRGVGWKEMTKKWASQRSKAEEFKDKRKGKEKEIDLGDGRDDLMASEDIELLD